MTPLRSIELGDQILKQDRLGRVRVPAKRRAQLLAEYERTSMSAAEFAGYVGGEVHDVRDLVDEG